MTGPLASGRPSGDDRSRGERPPDATTAGRVEIGRLTLRARGLTPAAAARLGDEVARDLARRLADGDGRPRPLGAVRIRVRDGSGPSTIADAVVRSLR
jgi:hypothetical protein